MRAKLDKLTGNLRESDLPSGVDLPAMQQQAHRHDNKSVLDKIGEADGQLLFDGAAVGGGDSVATQTENGLMSAADKVNLDVLVQAQIGAIALFAGADLPDGYLLCDGAELSRTVYNELFEAIGTTWGEGDGENTFNIPDLRGKFIRGCGGNAAPLGTEQSEGLPDATGWFKARYGTVSEVDHAAFSLMQAETITSTTYPSQQPSAKMSFSLSGANPIYGSSNHVTPINNSVYFIIKY